MNDMTLAELKREYRSAIDGSAQSRTDALKARDYYDGKQYTPEQLKIFAKRKQPPIVYNRVRKKVNGLLGFEITRRTDPVAYGRTDQDAAAAGTASKILRYIEEDQKVDARVTAGFGNMLVEGTGAIEVTVVEKRPDYQCTVRAIPWEMTYHDPRSRMPDFSDAAYLGISEWMSMNEAKMRYPSKEQAPMLEAGENGADGLDEDAATEDRPHGTWFDEKQTRVRIVQHWRIEGATWKYYTFTGTGILETGESPYKNEDGEIECPLIMQSCYVDKDNNRHGIVRDLFGPQDEINHRRSKLLHKLSEKQFYYATGALSDPVRTRQEMKKPDGVIEVNHGQFGKEFGVIEDTAQLQGQAELLQEAKLEIDTQGINPALIGRDTGAASGRAILATQQGAIAEEAIVFDRLRDFKLKVYNAMWARAKQFYKAERVIRITDDRRAPEYIGLNKTVGMSVDGRPIIKNPVMGMNIDLFIEEQQDSVTLQAEEFEKITKLMAEVPGFAQEVDMIDVLKASSLTNKHEWIEKLEKKREQAAQQPPNPLQQAAAQIELGKGEAEIKDKTASAGLKDAQRAKALAEIGKTQADIEKTSQEARVIPFNAAHQAAQAEIPANTS